MVISTKYNFVFVHIPKTGGTSIKRALYDYYDAGQLSFDGERVTDLNGYRPHVVMSEELSARYEGYFKFGFVRNPWSWHASIWKFFQRPDRNNKLITGVSFDDYLAEVCSGRTRLPYGRNQADWLYDGDRLLVDFVGRFERLRDDFAYVVDRVGVPLSATELPHFKNAGAYDYRAMYTSQTVDAIGAKHARDIALFGYAFDEASP